MAQNLLGVILLAITASSSAQILSSPSFRLQIPDGWQQTMEDSPSATGGDVLRLADPDGAGILKIRSVDLPGVVTRDALRNLTNLDSSIPLTWAQWGDYSGYQYDYIEKDILFRQWWLASEQTILLVTYERDEKCDDFDSELIDRIISSLAVSNTRIK